MKAMDKGVDARAVDDKANRVDLLEGGLLSVRDAAKLLGISRSALYEVMERGELVYVKLGRARRIPRCALEDLAARNLQGGWQQGMK